MTEIKIIGKRQLGDTQITHIEGGFGENEKCVLAKDIAEKHNQPLTEINRLINRNINKFTQDDIIDFLNGSQPLRDFAKENHLIGSNRTNNVYMFSERGYIKLVSMMDNTNETKWQVMQEFIDNYFKMRQEIKSNINETDLAILNVVKAENITDRMIAMNEYNNKIVKPLQAKIEEQEPLVHFANKVGNSSDLIDMNDFAKILYDEGIKLGRNNLFKWLRDNKFLMHNNLPFCFVCVIHH